MYHEGVLSSVVEHLTADQEVIGSNPVGPFYIYSFLSSLFINAFDCFHRIIRSRFLNISLN